LTGTAPSPTPFRIEVADAELLDLRARLNHARWPEPATVSDWSQGVPLAWLRQLCAYWADTYDWRRCQERLNSLPQVTTEVDGLTIHALHARSPQDDALPLVMTHGWPGSVVEFLDVIGPLADPVAHGGDAADAFHVVCPSLPGYGFSGKPAERGWGVDRIADAWDVLMSRLGFERYGAQGGDWGSAVSMALGERHADRVAGIHLNFAPAGPGREGRQDLTEFEQHSLADMAEHFEWGTGYSLEQATRPQTLGYGLVDSPVGLCAWITEKFWAWTDHDGDPTSALSPDQMLDNVTLYWLTSTAASSARLYWESGFARPSGRQRFAGQGPSSVPTGVSIFPKEIFRPSRRWCERRFTHLRFYEQLDRGGHFAAFEQPELFVDQVRRAFRTMR
jgi:pimeloyl-ACP methyl ester carboxylesterase